jgi:NAD(P)-dependent dehydrogenase (short-subunit alcohol dehydrogenase family)
MASKFRLDEKTTSDQIMTQYGEKAKDKYVIVTGGNTGIGKDSVRCLSMAGAKVVLACRSLEKGQQAIDDMKKINSDVVIKLMKLDLSDMVSIKEFANQYLASGDPLHILINNAGVMACPKELTKQAYELQMGTNHLGHFLLTSLLEPLLISSGTRDEPSRIINISSIANYLFPPKKGISLDDLKAEKHYDPWQRYGESKLANILHALELSQKYKEAGHPIIAVAVHPGVIHETDLYRHMDFSVTRSAVLNLIMHPIRFWFAITQFEKTIVQGSSTQLYCALSPDIISGEYYADCQVETKLRSPLASDKDLAKRLWAISTECVKSFQ